MKFSSKLEIERENERLNHEIYSLKKLHSNEKLDIGKQMERYRFQLRLLMGISVLVVIVSGATTGHLIKLKSDELTKAKKELVIHQEIAEQSIMVAQEAESQSKIAKKERDGARVKAEKSKVVADQALMKLELLKNRLDIGN